MPVLEGSARRVSWACQLVVAVILGQTLFFKFSGAAESVWIFSTLGAEPWGRIATGVIELIAALLVLLPRTAWLGAGLAAGTMLGAILSHLLFLGIEVMGDGGLLFGLAFVVLFAASAVLWLRRGEVPVLRAAF
jgi:uncharacterized membrane protein YphA (DoxX/SURF4 family)